MSTQTITLSGLAEPASIIVDRWGIAHIRAGSLLDMFFVQGFNAARDRLWQIDLWRKKGLGLLAADFGPGYLEQDRASRLFLFRGDMAREWASYGDNAEAICQRFVSGINAYVDLCSAEPERLPTEFRVMGTRPAKWQAEDVVRVRSNGWVRNALSEVVRSNVLASADAKTDLLRQNLEPAHDPIANLAGKVEALPLDCLDMLKLATAPVTFGAERLAASKDAAGKWRNVTPLGEVIQQANGQGSNNWAVHGSRTDTGRPILAGDPHRAHAVPSLRYIVHLSSPEFDGIGAGEPALPGISMGHNGTAAFGLTLFFGHDQEDVYSYETHPEDPHLYRYGDGWEAMRVLAERVKLADGGETTLVLKFTRHGPVVAEYPDRNLAVAIRSVWLEPGTAPYFQSIVSMHSRSFDEFRDNLAGWGVPAVNQVYADLSGTIGWQVAGFSPVRPNWDGLLPVSGDGSFEWQGYLDARRLPYTINPSAGYVATANEMNMPADWLSDNKPIGYEWIEPSRATRIAEVFAAETLHTLEGSRALQTDVLSIPARRLCRLLDGIGAGDDRLKRPLGLLRGWDHRLTVSSAAAALFEVWFSKHLRPALIAATVADPALRPLFGAGDVTTTIEICERGDVPDLESLLARTLIAADAECATLMGDDVAGWSWGGIHIALFEHAVSRVEPTLKAQLDAGPFGIGGSDSSPMNTAYRGSDFRLTLGASFRMVIDVGDWDRSLCINSPGQSGDSRSVHYKNLMPIWADGGYVPMLYSAEAVDREAETVIVLEPWKR